MREYEPYMATNKSEVEALLSAGDVRSIQRGLVAGAKFVEDWQWMQDTTIDFLGHEDEDVVKIAIQTLGEIALFQRCLDKEKALEVISRFSAEDKYLPYVNDAIENIEHFVGREFSS